MIVYLNNILIFSKRSIHIEDVKEILKLLYNAKLYIKLLKCEFNINKVEFLGFIILSKGIKINREQIYIIMK